MRDRAFEIELVLAADRPASDRSDTPGGPVLVVTGAFHTLALVDALSGAPEGALVRDRQPEGGFGPTAQGEAWLVRYDHERLDGLRGYGAGMPSPGYYERLHAAHQRELGFDGPGTGSPRDPRAGSGTAAGVGLDLGIGHGVGIGQGVVIR